MGRTSLFSTLWGLFSQPFPNEAQALENLSWLLDRGIPPDQALASALGKDTPSLSRGEKICALLRRAGWVSPGEAAFLEALERVGKLPQGLQALARFRQETRRAARAALGRAAYPLLVLHLALAPLQIPLLLHRGFGPALTSFLLWWAALDLGILVLAWQTGRAWRKGTLESWPLFGAWFLLGEKRRALFLLGELHGAGVLWDEALDLAARSVSAPSLKQGLILWGRALSKGLPPARALIRALNLEETCSGLLLSGEKTGRLQESLADCGKNLEDLFSRKARFLAGAAGTGLYALAVVVTLFVVLRAFLALYSAPFQGPR